MLGKYMPTHASKQKSAAISWGRVLTAVAPEPAALTAHVAAPMATVATDNMAVVEASVGTFCLDNCPNKVDPNKHDAMKQEKTVPYGVTLLGPKYCVTAAATAGGHCNTKMYMADSKRDWTAPTEIILGSRLMTLMASPMDGLSCFPPPPPPSAWLPLDWALFSFHNHAANNPPAAKNPVDNSKGPVGPRRAAAHPAICPAAMATRESPA
mmetsp:Transcript_17709/g.33340  ORF Transcript_17709/g.33340 Transcript_17709/m.33340 type:complete len:210 (+) Transcript_17709:314-943(+)